MRLRLPQYSGKDYLVLAIVILPFTVALNSVLFGGRYFTQWGIFLPSTLITAFVFSLDFTLCGVLAQMLKRRMAQEEDMPRRLFLMIVCFVLISGIFLLTIFHGYELIPSFNYTYNEKSFIWAYMSMAIVNIFLTLLIEGIYRYNIWRENLKETEKIKKTFTQSQLLGLKSQVNPHFLFNSLNTLSSLISEDEKEAEVFLNEMSKVYRYMLRGDDEQLVPLKTELKFIQSYIHLLGKRFGQSLQVKLNIQEEDKEKLLPPLSLQVLIENAFNQNVMSKADPLLITICSNGTELLVRNSRKPKMISNDMDIESGLDNLVTKYRLLNAASVTIKDEEKQRSIFLPLIDYKGGLV
ncbi:MAG TPA: histidine kinase [Flavisolibacter sp.]|nr:histidine kinase [Flavisolibacter sp.]